MAYTEAMLSSKQLDGLDQLQRDTFEYFWRLADPDTGLIPDSSRTAAPASIAATGMGLACYVIAAERRWITRKQAAIRTLQTLRTFAAPANPEAIGHRGFFYHFLDLSTAERAWKSEVSTIDTTFLLAGALTSAAYFERSSRLEESIRDLAAGLYRTADWRWARAGGTTVSHGWKPRRGFISHRWEGYNESLLLYALASGSSTHSIPATSYRAAVRSYRWKRLYGTEFLYAGPLFIHQLPHLWVDFRGIQDAFMRQQGIDYFENSRRATLIQQQYAIRNPGQFEGYGEHVWGISASDGPGPAVMEVNGLRRRFWDYRARGVPWGPDDGTIGPWAVVASLPFAPELVVRTLAEIDHQHPEMRSDFGYKCSFNPTYPGDAKGWVSLGYYGIEQGPIVLAIENYRTELIWKLMRGCQPLVTGLRRLGFRGGWLDA
jgi:hypothetical protein